MRWTRSRLAAYAGVATMTVTSTLAAAAPAQATTNYGCVYPRVCFYKTYADWRDRHPTASYRDYGRQPLGPASTRAYMVFNSRNDDSALLFAAAGTYCVLPNRNVATGDISATQIEIIDSPQC
jgi:hypothetical protein